MDSWPDLLFRPLFYNSKDDMWGEGFDLCKCYEFPVSSCQTHLDMIAGAKFSVAISKGACCFNCKNVVSKQLFRWLCVGDTLSQLICAWVTERVPSEKLSQRSGLCPVCNGYKRVRGPTSSQQITENYPVRPIMSSILNKNPMITWRNCFHQIILHGSDTDERISS